MSRNHRYQCTYSRCSAFFKNGKIYEVDAALVGAELVAEYKITEEESGESKIERIK